MSQEPNDYFVIRFYEEHKEKRRWSLLHWLGISFKTFIFIVIACAVLSYAAVSLVYYVSNLKYNQNQTLESLITDKANAIEKYLQWDENFKTSQRDKN